MCSYLHNTSKNAITHHKRKHNDNNNNKSKRARVSVGRLVDTPPNRSNELKRTDYLRRTETDAGPTHPLSRCASFTRRSQQSAVQMRAACGSCDVWLMSSSNATRSSERATHEFFSRYTSEDAGHHTHSSAEFLVTPPPLVQDKAVERREAAHHPPRRGLEE